MLNWHIKIDRNIYMQRIQNDQIKSLFIPVSRMAYLNIIFFFLGYVTSNFNKD